MTVTEYRDNSVLFRDLDLTVHDIIDQVDGVCAAVCIDRIASISQLFFRADRDHSTLCRPCRVNIRRVRRDRECRERHGDHDDREQQAQRFFNHYCSPP